ncbi:PIN domain-containing protein [Luteolibacter sp. Populi]|uniref:PIN domain-containing protein n=1 Tax=Luteolibacter sp. Populi TaxID=3230487 RepID=UPI003465AA7E
MLIDTSAWIDFFRSSGDLAAKLAVGNLRDEFQAAVCGPVAMELLGGAREQDLVALKGDLALLFYLKGGEQVWEQAAVNFRRLRSAAVTAPWNDIVIATIALRHSCRVFATDRHFALMAPILGIKLYEPGINGQYRPENE